MLREVALKVGFLKELYAGCIGGEVIGYEHGCLDGDRD